MGAEEYFYMRREHQVESLVCEGGNMDAMIGLSRLNAFVSRSTG